MLQFINIEIQTFYETINVGRSMFDVHQFLIRLNRPFFRPTAVLIWYLTTQNIT